PDSGGARSPGATARRRGGREASRGETTRRARCGMGDGGWGRSAHREDRTRTTRVWWLVPDTEPGANPTPPASPIPHPPSRVFPTPPPTSPDTSGWGTREVSGWLQA